MPVGLIESLDQEARGITRLSGKTIFVEGALPGEEVEYTSFRRKPHFELATTDRVQVASSQRVVPRCPHFGTCGGCSMQHLDGPGQVAVKQRVLEDALRHVGSVQAEQIYAPIYGPAWGYRYRARLSVRLVPKKGGVLVGFHERRSSYVADMTSCAVLPPRISALLVPLRRLIESLSIPDRIPQIEVAVGSETLVLVFRVLSPLTEADRDLLGEFSRGHGIVIFEQPKGPDSIRSVWPRDPDALFYHLPEFDISLRFAPTDFTQVNHGINGVLVRRAMTLLDPQPGEWIADMFCGLGNFTMPIARSGARVVGVEGSDALVRRAQANAAINGLDANAEFSLANLFTVTPELVSGFGAFDKMLIDPPREGAIELVKSLPDPGPSRIVYVSCNPATLARDASYLTHQRHYRLRGAGVVNMFPQTSHVESIAVFERSDRSPTPAEA